jgi:hypothetical protein
VSIKKDKYTFTPASRSVTIDNGNIAGQNFTGLTGYSISGRVSTSTGIAIPNVKVTCNGSNTTVLTNSAGYYTFNYIPNGSWVVTPALSGYSFSPTSKTVTVNEANVSGQNFIGSMGYTITGRISTSSGVAIANAAVYRSGSDVPVYSNSAGYYTLRDVPPGTYSLTAVLSAYTFTPSSRTVTVADTTIANENFIGG